MNTTVNLATEPHKTFFGKILAALGSLFSHLLTGAEKAWNDLSAQQQQEIVQGVNISQIIKEDYTKGEQYVLTEIENVTGLPQDVAEQVVLAALKDAKINVTKVQDGLDQIAAQVQAGITDNAWNGLWHAIAGSAAQWLSTGSLNWISLAMGLLEFAFQHFIKAKQTT